MKKILYIFSVVAVLMVVSSCELDLQQDPNNLSPDNASIEFVMNSVQIGMKDWFFEMSEKTSTLARLSITNPRDATYVGWLNPQDWDDQWELTYTTILSDAKTLIETADNPDSPLPIHAGIGRVIRAYVLITTVDQFGDIPYSQALDPENLEPGPDPGADVYTAANQDLTDAIANFATGGVSPTSDLFYNGDTDAWTALANTLKLRIAVTTKLAGGSGSAVDGLLGDAIGSGQDWAFIHGSNAAAPDSRHEFFIDNYIGGAADYASNYMMWLMVGENRPYGTDPRSRYYFYRQADEHTSDVNEMNCVQETLPSHYDANTAWCQNNLPAGYWGRDHVDIDGIPPDGQLRTIPGVYPAGGRFDDNSATPGSASDGLAGAGLHPLMMSFYVDFMAAEAALTMGGSADPAARLEAGIRGSIDYVMDFGSSVADASLEPTSTQIDNYVDDVMDAFNAANSAEKMEIFAEQYLISLYGNGIEAYNFYRRTGLPSNIQLPLVSQPGDFIRSLWYPAKAVNTNNNLSQKTALKTGGVVFWDQLAGDLN